MKTFKRSYWINVSDCTKNILINDGDIDNLRNISNNMGGLYYKSITIDRCTNNTSCADGRGKYTKLSTQLHRILPDISSQHLMFTEHTLSIKAYSEIFSSDENANRYKVEIDGNQSAYLSLKDGEINIRFNRQFENIFELRITVEFETGDDGYTIRNSDINVEDLLLEKEIFKYLDIMEYLPINTVRDIYLLHYTHPDDDLCNICRNRSSGCCDNPNITCDKKAPRIRTDVEAIKNIMIAEPFKLLEPIQYIHMKRRLDELEACLENYITLIESNPSSFGGHDCKIRILNEDYRFTKSKLVEYAISSLSNTGRTFINTKIASIRDLYENLIDTYHDISGYEVPSDERRFSFIKEHLNKK